MPLGWEDCHELYGPDLDCFKFCRFFPMVLSCHLFSFRSTHHTTLNGCAKTLIQYTKKWSYCCLFLFPFIYSCAHCPESYMCAVRGINTNWWAPQSNQSAIVFLRDSVCLKIFSVLFQAVGNTRLKYSHNTSLVRLTQHLSPGWKGCALPEGAQAACQPWDLPLHVSDGLATADTRHL